MPVTSAAAVTSRTVQVIFNYSGGEWGTGQGIGKLTSFTPPVAYKEIHWDFDWHFACSATLILPAKEKGTAVNCFARGSIEGGYQLTDKSDPAADCYAQISMRPSAPFLLGGFTANELGDVLHVGAGPPSNGYMVAQPGCGYPPGNIGWGGNLNTNVTTPSLLAHDAVVYQRHTSGELSGWFGALTFFHSTLVVAFKQTDTSSQNVSLRAAAVGILEYIGSLINNAHESEESSHSVWPDGLPVIETTGDGVLHIYLRDQDPLTLLDFRIDVHAFTSTAIPMPLTNAGRADLADAIAPPRLLVELTFTPNRGPVSQAEIVGIPQLMAYATSVSFGGSASAPTVTINGKDLGPRPRADPATLEGQDGCPSAAGTYGTDYGAALSLTDVTGNWGAGRYVPGLEVDCIGLLPSSATPGALTFSLGSFYADNPAQFSLAEGDQVQLVANGAFINVHVTYGSTVSG